MLDKKEVLVLKVLNKLAFSSNFKVVTNEEIITMLPANFTLDNLEVKNIIEFLGKEGYINLKFAEDSTYCYAILPKTTMYFAQELSTPKQKKSKSPILIFAISMLASFIGTMVALMIFFYFTI